MQTGQSGFYLNEVVEFNDGFNNWRGGFTIIEFRGMILRLAAPKEGHINREDFKEDWWPLSRIRKVGFARTRLI